MQLITSVFWDGVVKNYDLINTPNGQFTFDRVVFKSSLKELLQHYRDAMLVLPHGGAMLVNPIRRQAWELRRSDIVQERKLGEGAFG